MKNTCNENLIILYSGGADSRLMLEMALEAKLHPYGLLIDYGQLHKEELIFAEKQLSEKNVSFHTIHVQYLNINSGLTGDGIKNDTKIVHSMHVPGRNSIFLSLAFSVAESRGIDTIWYGPDFSDRLNLFPDCYQEYVYKINELFKIAGPKPIKVEAPLMGMTKELILRILESKGINKEEIFSGYGGL